MNIDLKLRLSPMALDRLAASTLATLGSGIELPNHDEQATLACQFISDDCAALHKSLRRLPGRQRQVFIVVSADLVETGPDGEQPSALATRLLEQSWSKRIVVGLIGINRSAAEHVSGLDCVIGEDALDGHLLRAAVHKVARTLWYKLPPRPRAPAARRHAGCRIQRITNRSQFRQSLRLRHEIYTALGYIDRRIAEAGIGLEFDGYDPAAVHYAVTSREQPGRVAGTMRIIVPGRRALPELGGARDASYASWCEEFANEEESRVFRDLLYRRSMNSLPMLDSFDYFASAGKQCLLHEMVFPDLSCEVSRIVVHPDFRGLGILDMLIEKAIAVAARMGKRYLLLECAPFHEHMYSKYGFRVVEDERSERYYARAQRLDSWAIAMHREIGRGDGHGKPPTRTAASQHLESSGVTT